MRTNASAPRVSLSSLLGGYSILIHGGPAIAIVAATSKGAVARIAGRAKVFRVFHLIVILLSGGRAWVRIRRPPPSAPRHLGATELGCRTPGGLFERARHPVRKRHGGP